MSEEQNIEKKVQEIAPEEKFEEAEPGRGAPGNQTAVQTAQTTAVNPPDAEIPSNVDKEKSVQEVKAVKAQEAGTGEKTTSGYTIDESGRLDNFPVEPEIYVDDK